MRYFISFLRKLNLFVAFALLLAGTFLLLFKDVMNPTSINSNGRIAQQTAVLSASITNKNIFDDLISKKDDISVKESDQNAVIRIPSIGVDTKMFTGEDPRTLEKGAWILPSYGLPSTQASETPIVIAAHRWGADDASYDYRAKNLFFNLPQLKEGEIVELVWGGEVFRYRVNYKEENNYVSRLEDLILVTCKYYNSLERIFIYAEKI